MNNFEEELKVALHPIDPPPGFTERLLERLAQEPAPPARRTPVSTWFAAAAALILMAGSGALYKRHEHEIQGEVAKKQLLVALRVAGSKLQQAQERVYQVGKPEVN